MLYLSLSYHVDIISEGWKQFRKVGEVSWKRKNSDEQGSHCGSNFPVYTMNSWSNFFRHLIAEKSQFRNAF